MMKDTTNFIVRNALTYMDTHYNQKLTLTVVANAVYISKWHLSRLLNTHMQQNFSTILNCIRIEHAKELLMDPALNISEVAERTGYLDSAHFSRVFRSITGMSPKEYRNSKKTKTGLDFLKKS